VIVALPATALQRLVDETTAGSDTIGSVIDGSGAVLAQSSGAQPPFAGLHAAGLLAQLGSRRDMRVDPAPDIGMPEIAHATRSADGWVAVTALSPQRHEALVARTRRRQTLLALFALALLALAAMATLLISRRLAKAVDTVKALAQQLSAGTPVMHQPTGVAELDGLGRALEDASAASQQHRQRLEQQAEDALAHTRLAEQRISQGQRITAMGNLMSTLAHGFNNLLGIVANNAQLMRAYAKGSELMNPLASTLRTVEAGSELTRRVMRFADRRPTAPQLIALQRFMPEVHDLLRSLLGGRVEVTSFVAPDTSPILVDAAELELALVNLGLNARSALGGAGELTLQAHNLDSAEAAALPALPHLNGARHWVRLSVSDDGRGIAPELVDKVFEPFFTTKAAGKGLGLGLSQVRAFCEQAGGTVRLASTPGLGTTVSLLLPSAATAA
ncbi:MAG: hypothetical protein EOP35_17405, partial [Rubrivivax sp.]